MVTDKWLCTEFLIMVLLSFHKPGQHKLAGHVMWFAAAFWPSIVLFHLFIFFQIKYRLQSTLTATLPNAATMVLLSSNAYRHSGQEVKWLHTHHQQKAGSELTRWFQIPGSSAAFSYKPQAWFQPFLCLWKRLPKFVIKRLKGFKVGVI